MASVTGFIVIGVVLATILFSYAAIHIWYYSTVDKPLPVYLPTSKQECVVFVTGTSTGIGRDAVIFLALNGYTVFATVRQQHHADELLAALEKEMKTGKKISKVPGKIIPVVMELTSDESVEAAANVVKSYLAEHETAKLAGIINNAGIAIAAFCENVEIADIHKTMEVNFVGAVRVTKAFLPTLRKHKGRVISTSSISGVFALPVCGSYAASKFALEGWIDCLRREVRQFDVGVSLIEPAMVESAITLANAEMTPEEAEAAEYQAIANMTESQKIAYAKSYKKTMDQLRVSFNPKTLCKARNTTSVAFLKALTDVRPKDRYMTANAAGVPAWFFKFLQHRVPTKLGDFLIH